MLEIRPNCEWCDKDLPPQAPEARICTYECTFCADCVEVLRNVCPNCGGGFEKRPIRPAKDWRPGAGLGNHPASDRRRHMSHDEASVRALSERLADIPPEER